MDEYAYKPIYINGKKIIPFDLVNNAVNINFSQKEEITEFVSCWLNKEEYIEVKTSGSTGIPKKILLKKQAFIESALQTIHFFNLNEDEIALLCLPVNFIAGKMMLLRSWIAGLNLLSVKPSLNPLEHISQDTFIDFAAMTPMQVSALLENINGKEKINRIKNLIIGGAPVNKSLEQKLQSLQTCCYESYGMTETLSHVALKKLNGHNRTNSFKALKGISFEVDNRNCLIINAPKLCNDKIITNDVVDLIWTDEFIWKGRYDNVINSGGIKIFPEELEKKLENILNRNYFISSLPDEKSGEKVVLVIEGKKFDAATQKLFNNYLLNHFEKHFIPKEILFIENFVYTETNKINRTETLKLLQP